MSDPGHVDEQYGTDARLAARQNLWRHRTGPSLVQRLLDAADLGGDESIVEVGCGNGVYLAALRQRGHRGRLAGLDRSRGMAAIGARHAPTAVADAQSLPLRDASADVVLALHMLYHVPDIPRAVREFARVRRPNGTVLVATNDNGHTGELRELAAAAARSAAGVSIDWDWDLRPLPAAAAHDHLAAAFADVRRLPLPDTVAVPDAATVLAYLASWGPGSLGLPAAVWPDVLAAAGERLADHFARQPTFTVTSRAVLLIAR